MRLRWGPLELEASRKSPREVRMDDKTYALLELVAQLKNEAVRPDGRARRDGDPVRPVTDADIEAVLEDIVHMHYQQYCMRR